MAFLPISLGIARPEPSGRVSTSKKKKAKRPSAPKPAQAQNRQAPKEVPKELKEKILKRDNDTCRFCGFQANKYQTIHYLDHNPNNLSESNLATACIFCHQCFNLDMVGNMTSGTLIWMPEIEQHQLHHMARAIYVARISQGPIAEAARKALDAIMERRKEAIKRIDEKLQLVGLTYQDFAGKYPNEFSGGQLQRISIARALVTEPKLIIADEPVSMVDASLRMSIVFTKIRTS